MLMQIRSAAVVILLVALLAPEAIARVKVTVNFDKAFDFKSMKTWGWGPDGPGSVMMARTANDNPDAMKKAAEPLIVEAITKEMAARALVQSSSAPDLVVTYYLLLSNSMSSQTMGQFLPATSAWGLPFFPQATQSLEYVDQGSLVIDLAANKTVVWRGVAHAKIKPDTAYKKREGLIREGVRDLMRRYPTKQ
jgi:hypothetical protein